ncbi:MAG: amidohydrolase family protein [Cyclobacteriaceae bacterium]|jgi:imidazolonepropionase-like amidohydrolase
MKHFTITLFLAFVLTANVTAVFGQANPLINTWKIDEKSLPAFSEVVLQRIRKVSPDQAKQMEAYPDAVADLIKALEFTFGENGVYELNTAQGKQAGTWKRVGNDLITQITGGGERKDSIISVTKNKLILLNREVRKRIEYVVIKTEGTSTKKESPDELENEKKEFSQTKAIKNVSVVDVTMGKVLENQTVVWKEGKIISVLPGNKTILPADAVVVDGQGKFVLPGLMDSHIHFFQSGGLYTRPDGFDFTKVVPYEKDQQWIKDNHTITMKRYIANGITSVVDVGGPLSNFTIRDSINPKIRAPHTIVTGPLISTYGPLNLDKADPPIIKVNNAEEARALVRKQLPYKPSFIKIWFVVLPGQKAEQFSAEVGAAIDEAHKNNLKVAVHATELATAKEAIRLGADLLVHSIDDVILDDAFLKIVKVKKIVYIPTLQVAQQAYRIIKQQFDFTSHELAWSDPTQLSSLLDLQHLDPKDLNGFNYKAIGAQFNIPSKSDSIMLVNLKRVADYGITIATGTDAGNPGVAHGASYLREIEMMKQAGLSNWQVLKASTIDVAKSFGVSNAYGSIERGKVANFILLHENPLQSLKALEKIETVYLNGYGYIPADLLPKTVDELAKAEVNAYNARNIDAFVARYAPDAEIYDISNPTVPIAKGSKQIREIWGGMFNQLPNLHCHVTSRTILGNKCVAIESISGVGPTPMIGVGTYFFNLKTGLIEKVYFVNER